MKRLLKNILLLFFIIVLAGFAVIVWTACIEPNLLITKNVNLSIQNWHKEHNNFKIAVISDLHIGSLDINLNKVKQIVELTNKNHPDIIFILGDYDAKAIYNSNIRQKDLIKALKGFKAPYGVASVLGNHDFKPDKVRGMLNKTDIIVLENKYIRITKNHKIFYVVGLKDLWHYRPNVKNVVNKVKNKNNPVILLSHNPDVFPDVPDKVSLTLAGHNHGGQVYVPFLGGLFLPSVYGQRFVKGYIAENNKNLYVTSGIGNVGPGRFGNIPEIVFITLNKSDSINKQILNTPPKKGINFSLINAYIKLKNSTFWKHYFVPVYNAFR